jgi:eukaryotic-like serine/threonine-protein kinase
LQSQANESAGAFSPDGRWVVYVSDESDHDEIYVQSFPLPGSKFQISNGGGAEPYWRKDGAELFYVTSGRNLIAIPIKFSPSFERGSPKRLMFLPAISSIRTYAASGDGQRFLVLNPATGAAELTITVIVNWQAALKK